MPRNIPRSRKKGGFALQSGEVNVDDIHRKVWPMPVAVHNPKPLHLSGNAYSETQNRLNILKAEGTKARLSHRVLRDTLTLLPRPNRLVKNAFSETGNRLNRMIVDGRNPSKSIPTLGAGRRHIGLGHQQVRINPRPDVKSLLIKRAILMGN